MYIKSKWPQVCILIKWNGRLSIFEATNIPVCNDVDNVKFDRGVQLVWFSEKLSVFDGKVAVRKLNPSLTISQENELLKFVNLVRGKPFNNSKYFMARAKERRNIHNDNESFFCSQLVAKCLQEIQI